MARIDPRVFNDKQFRTLKALPFHYLLTIVIVLPLFIFYKQWDLLMPSWALYFAIFWILSGHILCGFSYWITSLSLKKGFRLFQYSWSVYTSHGSLSYFQNAFLTSIGEEAFFRYFLLSWIYQGLPNIWLASLINSLIFSLFHFRKDYSLKNLLRYLDLFIFSYILCLITLFTNSLYPVLFIHGIRNYLVKTMFITVDQYKALESKQKAIK